MSITIYHNPNCETSRNVLALIRNSGVEPLVIEYLKTPLNRTQLMALIGELAVPVRDIMRRKGTPYDALKLDDASVTDDDLIAAIVLHPILMNRPVVATRLGTRLCRPSEAVLSLLSNPQRAPISKENGEVVVAHAQFNAKPAL